MAIGDNELKPRMMDYAKYLTASETDIKEAFLELARADYELSLAQQQVNAAAKAKDSPISPADLGILSGAMQPKELNERIAQIQKARESNFADKQELFLIKQFEFRQIGIIVDGIKQIVANRKVCAND